MLGRRPRNVQNASKGRRITAHCILDPKIGEIFSVRREKSEKRVLVGPSKLKRSPGTNRPSVRLHTREMLLLALYYLHEDVYDVFHRKSEDL